jgi:hypothetical protein
MLPAVATAAISGLTEPGELVFDPMCGAGTTLVEAMHLGRAAVGVDIEPRWSSLARDNIAHTRRLGVGGYGHVITGDARSLPAVLPPQYLDQMRGQVKLVPTCPCGFKNSVLACELWVCASCGSFVFVDESVEDLSAVDTHVGEIDGPYWRGACVAHGEGGVCCSAGGKA